MNIPHVIRPYRALAFLALVVLILSSPSCASDTQVTRPRASAPSFDGFPAQDLVPVADVSNPGNLEPFGNLWTVVDENPPNDDVDYIWRYRTGLPPTVSGATMRLSSPTSTPDTSQRNTLKVRLRVDGNYSNNTPQPTYLRYSLQDLSGNTIMTKTLIPTGNSYITDSVSVDPHSIANYGLLQLYVEMELKPATQFDQIQGRLTWARLEIR
jgi:hypothetical protein